MRTSVQGMEIWKLLNDWRSYRGYYKDGFQDSLTASKLRTLVEASSKDREFERRSRIHRVRGLGRSLGLKLSASVVGLGVECRKFLGCGLRTTPNAMRAWH